MKIKEVIVVEGKNDTNTLQSFVDCDTIETHGTRLSKETLELIRVAKETRGVIIFTDPDFPGEKIRQTINDAIPGCKQVFVEQELAKTPKKVGVEHASREVILDALSHAITYHDGSELTLSLDEFRSLGLEGRSNSASRRDIIAKKLHLGKPNAKTLYKRLNMLGITYDELVDVLGGTNE